MSDWCYITASQKLMGGSTLVMSDTYTGPIKERLGFVYIIKHKDSGHYYIGKKQFWSKRTIPPLKGRKNKRHQLVESNWRSYWGSSNKFKEFVEQEGKENFDRIMVSLHDSKFDLSLAELKLQLNWDVLEDPLSFNEMINVRLRKRK